MFGVKDESLLGVVKSKAPVGGRDHKLVVVGVYFVEGGGGGGWLI